MECAPEILLYVKALNKMIKKKSRLSFLKRDFLNMAPLTGIAFASKWLISKLSLNLRSVKTTRMTTF